jgi:hypothetical protein
VPGAQGTNYAYAKNVGPSALQGAGAFQSARKPGRAPQRRHGSPGGRSAGAASTRRQDGQEECARSHVSTQAAWNAWPHCGSTRMAWPSSNSARQMAHSSAPAAAAALALPLSGTYVTVGSERSTSFFTPLLAALVASSAAGCDRDAAAQRHEHAHRATRPSPSTQTSAQSRPARIRIMSELRESAGGPEPAAASRSIRAMVCTLAEMARASAVGACRCCWPMQCTEALGRRCEKCAQGVGSVAVL